MTGTTTSLPIRRHKAFPAALALWFAALLGLIVLVLPTVLLDRAVSASGLAPTFPLLVPPLGTAGVALIAFTAACAGALFGLLLARFLRRKLLTGGERDSAETPPIPAESVEDTARAPLRVREEIAIEETGRAIGPADSDLEAPPEETAAPGDMASPRDGADEEADNLVASLPIRGREEPDEDLQAEPASPDGEEEVAPDTQGLADRFDRAIEAYLTGGSRAAGGARAARAKSEIIAFLEHEARQWPREPEDAFGKVDESEDDTARRTNRDRDATRALLRRALDKLSRLDRSD